MDGSATGSGAVTPWLSLGTLTYSFAPDGTSIGESQSSLFSTLNQTGNTSDWQAAVSRAFEAWLSPMSDNATAVPDSGDAFGVFGPTQGDSRFGDIRIGAVPLSMDVFAEAIPHSLIVGGSWAGDILLNSNAHWNSLQQVYEVTMHEIGHSLGLSHSTDTDSVMYSGGVGILAGPSNADILQLKKLYSGLHIEHTGDSNGNSDSELLEDWHESPQFAFDVHSAIDLSPSKSDFARYVQDGELTTTGPAALYRLLPIGEIDGARYLNVTVSALDQNGLIPEVAVYDTSGDKMPWNVLHNSNGTISIQARDVESSQTYYVAITAAAAPLVHQTGRFNLFAEYSKTPITATKIGTFSIGQNLPVVEYKLTVHTTRLVHWMVQADMVARTQANVAVWGTLVDSNNKVVSRLALRPGSTRSASLVMLPPGEYRVRLETGTQDPKVTPMVNAALYFDEISVDIGTTIVDPTTQPMLGCDTPGSNPATCTSPPPIIINGPLYPVPPTPATTTPNPFPAPWNNPTWYYWPIVALAAVRNNALMTLDANSDSTISPLDALMVINAINAGITPDQPATNASMFVDTNNDGLLTPLDVLVVVNYLNNQSGQSNGEGEQCRFQGFMPLDFWQDADGANWVALRNKHRLRG